MSEKAAEATEVQDPAGLRAGGERRTEFRGVCRRRGGKFAARIKNSKGKPQTWLGTFDTAEDAARAFDDAAVRMHGAAAKTNFNQPAATDDGGDSWLLHVPAEPSGHDARTKFRGVNRQSSGRFGARIAKEKAETWLGTFDTAEEAARAYDDAAVKAFGARARTNFEQPAAGQRVHRHPSGGERIAPVCGWKGKAAQSLGGFDSPDTRHDVLSVNLPPVSPEWQQVYDDSKARIEAAVILQHISLAGHGDGGR